MDYLLLTGGLIGLFFGGEALVRGAASIAHRLAIPPLLIGLTVVGFGTSTPELLVSVDAALRGTPDIAIGNVVGSNIGNILLIVGLSAVIWPIRVSRGTLSRDTAVMMAAALVLLPLFWVGEMGRLSGALLIAGLAGYLLWAFLRPGVPVPDEGMGSALPGWQALLWILAGLAALLIGARLLVDGAVNIARELGVSEAFIGLTVVAVGTSLPELATSLIAAFRRQSEIAIGNIVGSNVFNVLGILGATALIAPIPVAGRFVTFDLPVMIAVTGVLAGLLLLRPSIERRAGMAFLAAYAAYIWAAQGST
ncbi:MAG: sodium:calcium antiporter [Alphaproteobacteria bacterium]|nr:sodium:calcium antiporter [Alphaproteobacteria bacterium]MDX5368251.1 sodium:calcium antiporter [Alphaproteobacteria bacterium]MDX5463060.1 sodium:calcium antiporter [Alphaproteobacteria bacterium]